MSEIAAAGVRPAWRSKLGAGAEASPRQRPMPGGCCS